MTKLIGYFFIPFFCWNALALVPVEGLLLGRARENLQYDPLAYIFRDLYDKSSQTENSKVKLYHHFYLSGQDLTESCQLYQAPRYGSSWNEKQARRTMVATLQYLGLDTSIKAIGAYAAQLSVGEDEYKRLTKNLVLNYCSKNLTVLSLRNVAANLDHYYRNPVKELLPEIGASPFATKTFKDRTGNKETRSVEFDYAIRNFRAFCSWGGETLDYRLMGPYLKNPFIMAFLIKNMLGVQDRFDPALLTVKQGPSEKTVQVACSEHICRRSTTEELIKKFPLSVGSTGLKTDLRKIYCHHFRFQDYSSADAIPEVKAWIKASDLEDPVLETSFLISLMTGVPDPIFGTAKYIDLPFIVKSSIDERWNNWARDVLSIFSRDMMFEEAIRVKMIPNRSESELRQSGFSANLSVTLGEMDRLMDATDKIGLGFNLKLTKNYLRKLRGRWVRATNELDMDEQKAIRQELYAYLELQIQKKEKHFKQKMWNKDLARLIGDELVAQAVIYNGKLFNSYQDEVLTVPVNFHYGVFALNYLKYRADVNANRLKIKL